MSNSEFLDKLKGLIEIEHVSGEPGMTTAQVVQFLVNPNDAGNTKLLVAAKWAAHEQNITTLLILGSDP